MSEPKLTEAQTRDLGKALTTPGLHVFSVVARMIAEAEQTARAEGWDEGHDGLTSARWERNPYRSTP